MGDVIKFERIKHANELILLTYDPRELVDVSEADALVSWNIDGMSVDELREKGKLQKRIIELEQANER